MKLKDEAIARQLEQQITSALKNKFTEQGHNLSGKGIKSLETHVKDSLGGVVIQIMGLDYMGYQDSGRKAGKMPPIAPLIQWVKKRGIASDMKTAKRIAFGIAINHKKVGMHLLKGSGKDPKIDMSKRHFISSTITHMNPVIQQSLFKMFEKNFNLVVTNLTTQMTKTIINL